MVDPFQIYGALAALAAIGAMFAAAGPIEIVELELGSINGSAF